MIIRQMSHANYQALRKIIDSRLKETPDAEDTLENSYYLDHLDIDIKNWRAFSTAEGIISSLSNKYSERGGDFTRTSLRSFYAQAKDALDTAFENISGKYPEQKNFLDSTYQQAVKELKDWYHNGGEPREKVDLTVVNISHSSVEKELALEVDEVMDDSPEK